MASTQTCKEDYYKDYIETNKKEAKKIWNDLRNLASIKKSNKTSKQIMMNISKETKTDNKIIANHFNEFFTSVAGKLIEKIPAPKSTFQYYLTKTNENYFLLILPLLKKLKIL